MIFIFIITFILVYVTRFYWRVRKYPKGPFPLPLIGNIHQLNFENMYLDISKYSKQYGPVFTLWYMENPTVVLTSYEALKEALLVKGDLMTNRPIDATAEILMSTPNGGIAFSSGGNWREQRRITLQILRDFGVGKNSLELMIHDQLHQLFENIEKYEDKGAINFRNPIQKMVANIINHLLFGFSYPHHDCDTLLKSSEIVDSFFGEIFTSPWVSAAQMFPILRKLPYTSYKSFGRFQKLYDEFLIIVKGNVDKVLKNYSVEEEPSCFAQAYYQKMEDNTELNLPNLYNNCSDFSLAGMATTTSTLRWMVLYFAAYPQIQKKLREELANIVGFNRLPTMSDKNKMPYTQAVILEVQRHSSMFVGSLNHQASQDMTILGMQIPAGTTVYPHFHEIYIDEVLFPEPKEFKPARFLNPSGDTINQDLANKMIVFGMGKRQCAGEGLAKTEIFLFSTALIQKYEFYPPKDGEVDLSPIDAGIDFLAKDNFLQIQNVVH